MGNLKGSLTRLRMRYIHFLGDVVDEGLEDYLPRTKGTILELREH